MDRESKFEARNRNNFNILRVIAASLVVLSHGYELPTGAVQHDWAFYFTGRALSWYAVNLFFVISGYLIFASWERNPSPLSFFWARFLRIVPGLFVMLVTTVLVLGASFSTLPFFQYIVDYRTLQYLLGCLSVIAVRYELPGVFVDNPNEAVNGSLWTLRYEVFCYVCVAAIGMTGLLKVPGRRMRFLVAGILASSLALIFLDIRGVHPSEGKLAMAYELARLTMCFQLGGLYSDLRHRLPLKFVVVVGLLAVMIASVGTPLFAPVASITIAYAAMWLAFVPDGEWIAWTRSAPDYSYGIYIYAFPIQQALIAAMPTISPFSTFALGFCLTVVPAALSWHFVERPAITHKQLRSLQARTKPTPIAG
ncbi:acyltransferase [Bradyrhizobium sp. CCGB12]|uniref:acyltransferase family protein n=1 Tax=Bradyrhizobium sp. CCGB12 TaxID=2949632 RepID=UPI0020B31AA1|nr:acyltransferase [Bradyrhizobium sp. CCGB12]MCP3390684.1 acyltransferase [Bradyrhizobium sp. CCGB12]